jgi:HEAT repeat protein
MSFLFGPPNVEKLKSKRNVPGLIKALSYKKYTKVRGAAAEALGQISDARAVEALSAALKDSELHVRMRAAALEKTGWQPTDGNQRAWHAVALRAWGLAVREGTAAVDSLLAALKDSNENVRKSAAMALERLATPERLNRSSRRQEREEKVTIATALQNILEHAGSSIGSRHLISIAQLGNVVCRIIVEIDCTGNMGWNGRLGLLDCSPLRQLARQELIRRGEQA